MQVMRTVLTGAVATVVLVAGWAGSGVAGAEQDTVTVRGLELEAGDVVTVALHPSTTPIELSAQRLDLEACPGTWDGHVATTENTSWPRRDGFIECIPFTDGAVTLPAAGFGGGAMHLVFAVRARASNARPGVLTIRYEAADGFFVIAPPALDGNTRGPAIAVAAPASTIAAGVTSYTVTEDRLDLRDVRLAVHQRGRIVPESKSSSDAARHHWPVYAPVEPGRPVSLRAINEGPAPIRFAIGIDV